MLSAVLPMAVGPTMAIRYLYGVSIDRCFYKKSKGTMKNKLDQNYAIRNGFG
jgi:hypothetical protein